MTSMRDTKLGRSLLRFARAMLAEETCEQGGPEPCGRPAAFEGIGPGHLMCGTCVRAWYPTDEPTAIDDEDEHAWFAEGIREGWIRRTKAGAVKRIEARRRDAADAGRKLTKDAVEILLVLERRHRRRGVAR